MDAPQSPKSDPEEASIGGSPQDDPPAQTPYETRAAVLNRAIQAIGMGRYQWQLFAVIGFGWASDNLWPIVTSLILVPVSYEFPGPEPELLTLAQNIGLLIGALFWGFGCDIFGRRWAFNLTIAITGLFGLIAAGSPSFRAIATFAALWSVGVGGNLPVDSAIFLEFLPGSHQYLLTVLSIHWALAQLLATLVAWPLIGRRTCASAETCTRADNMGWRYFLIAMGGLAVVMFIARFLFFTLFESPKYLMGRGRHAQAVAVVHEVARRNGQPCHLTPDALDVLADDHPDRAAPWSQRLSRHLEPLALPHVRALFHGRRRALATTLLIAIWGLIGLGYPLYNAFLPFLQQTRGVQFGDGSIDQTYRNSLIIAVVGVPGSLLGGYLVEQPRMGRRGSLTAAVLATGTFLLASTTARTSAALLGWNCAFSFSSSLMYAVLYAYTPEIFDTQHRGTGNALVSAANRVGGILAPIIALVSDMRTSVPVWVSGGLFLAAGGMVMLIPYETRGKMAN